MAVDDYFPDAAKARELSFGHGSQRVQNLLKRCEVAIRSAATMGQTSVYVDADNSGHEVREAVVKLLREKGYTASHSDDQRDGAWLSVRW